MQRLKPLVPTLYIVFLMLPIYWLLSMSFKTTNEILGGFSPWPQQFTLDNYRKIFTDRTWYMQRSAGLALPSPGIHKAPCRSSVRITG